MLLSTAICIKDELWEALQTARKEQVKSHFAKYGFQILTIIDGRDRNSVNDIR